MTMLALALALHAAEPPIMPQTPRATVVAMFDAFNRHDPEAMARLYAADARLTSPYYCEPRRQADIARSYQDLFAAYPDIRDEAITTIVDGERVAVRLVARSAAGKLHLPIMAMLRVRDGLIVEDDVLFDAGGKPCSH